MGLRGCVPLPSLSGCEDYWQRVHGRFSYNQAHREYAVQLRQISILPHDQECLTH
jgi:hypothetical protein